MNTNNSFSTPPPFTLTSPTAIHSSLLSSSQTLYTFLSSHLGPNHFQILLPFPSESETETESDERILYFKTNISTTLLSYISSSNSNIIDKSLPEIKLLHSLIRSSNPRGLKKGDATLFHACLTTRLLSLAYTETSNNAAKKCIVRGYEICGELINDYLLNETSPCVIEIQLDKPMLLLTMIESNLNCKSESCGLSSAHSDSRRFYTKDLAVMLLKSFLSSINDNTGKSDVIFHSVLGYHSCRIKAHSDTVVIDLEDKCFLEGFFRPNSNSNDDDDDDDGKGKKENQKIALFKCSLYTSKNLGVDETKSHELQSKRFHITSESSTNIQEVEITELNKLYNTLIAHNIEIVLCQRQVHPYLCALLKDYGVKVMQRLGIVKLEQLERVLNVESVGDWLTWEGFGGVGVCCFGMGMGGGDFEGGFVSVQNNDNTNTDKNKNKPTTIILTSKNKHEITALIETCTGIIHMLERVFSTDETCKYALVGAGVWEGLCGDVLKDFLDVDKDKGNGNRMDFWTRKGVGLFKLALKDCSVLKVGRYDFDRDYDNDFDEDGEGDVRSETFKFLVTDESISKERCCVKLYGLNSNSDSDSDLESDLNGYGNSKLICSYHELKEGGKEVEKAEILDFREPRVNAIGSAVEICQVLLSLGGGVVLN